MTKDPVFDNSGSINQFLHYGYLINPLAKLPFHLANSTCSRKAETERDLPIMDRLISEGVKKLRAAFEGTFQQNKITSNHIVPISGGLDSRAILGWLTENIKPSEICTVTFGPPGTWDFEIGKLVAKQAGVRNEAIDLTKVNWKTENLISFARLCEQPIPLFEGYLFHQIRVLLGKECVYWSGFMGDPLSGTHLPEFNSASWEKAKVRFSQRNRFSRSIDLDPPCFKSASCLPSTPLYPDNILSFDEQLDFAIRQQCYIKPLVLLQGYTYRTPFLHPEWVGFILNLPRRYREKQYLYKEILKTAYTKLFSLPTKTNYGLPLDAPRWRKAIQLGRSRAHAAAKRYLPWINWGMSPGMNYIDFDRGLRESKDLKQVAYENIQDLKKRRIVDWIDMDSIWQRHQRNQGNHADALTLLTSLEINLKALEVHDRSPA